MTAKTPNATKVVSAVSGTPVKIAPSKTVVIQQAQQGEAIPSQTPQASPKLVPVQRKILANTSGTATRQKNTIMVSNSGQLVQGTQVLVKLQGFYFFSNKCKSLLILYCIFCIRCCKVVDSKLL